MTFKKQTIITPTDTPFSVIVGKDRLPYSQVLKKLWAYWKANKLNAVEPIL